MFDNYNLSQPITIGPPAIPAANADEPPDAVPTGLTVAAGAKHGYVEVFWDEPPADSNVTGFALFRQWRGHQDALNLCLYWHTNSTNYQDGHIAAYDSSSNRNQYIYKRDRVGQHLAHRVPVQPEHPGGLPDAHPSTITARRTRRYTSTWNIHRTIHKLSFKPMDGGRRYGIQPPNVSDLSAYVAHFNSAFYTPDRFEWSSSLPTKNRKQQIFQAPETHKATTTSRTSRNCCGQPNEEDPECSARKWGRR